MSQPSRGHCARDGRVRRQMCGLPFVILSECGWRAARSKGGDELSGRQARLRGMPHAHSLGARHSHYLCRSSNPDCAGGRAVSGVRCTRQGAERPPGATRSVTEPRRSVASHQFDSDRNQNQRWKPNQCGPSPPEEPGDANENGVRPNHEHEKPGGERISTFERHSSSHEREKGNPGDEDDAPDGQRHLHIGPERRWARNKLVEHVRVTSLSCVCSYAYVSRIRF